MTQPMPPQPAPPPIAPTVAGIAALEAAIAALMLAAYTAWLARVVAAVLAAFHAFGAPPDPTAVWSTVPAWNRHVEQLMAALLQIARAGWIQATRDLGVDVPFNPTDPLLADQLERTRNLMVRTPDEVYRIIVAELGEAVARGESVEQQAARVSHVLDATGTENWAARAQTVAVTEVHRAWNMGAQAAALRVQADGAQVLMKRWDSREDSRVRRAHRDADGQTVPVSQPFIVDLEPLIAPGDPAGSPHNVINCRCKAHFSYRGA